MASETSIEDNIIHRNKHTPFGGASGLEDWVEEGVDWSGATFVMTIAEAEGAAAKITLNGATAGSQGISATFDAGHVSEVTGAVVGATTIRPQIDETTFEGLTTFPTAPAPYELVYDLLCTPSGEPQRVIYHGTFTIYHGVGD